MMKYLQQQHVEYNNSTTTAPPTSMESGKRSSTNSNSTIAYMLFVYREELRKSQGRLLKLSKSKLNLTQELVSYSVDRITEYDMDELMNINRQISFTRKLKSLMDRTKQLQRMRSSTVKSTLTKGCATS